MQEVYLQLGWCKHVNLILGRLLLRAFVPSPIDFIWQQLLHNKIMRHYVGRCVQALSSHGVTIHLEP